MLRFKNVKTVHTFFYLFVSSNKKANLIALQNSNTAGQTSFELHLQGKKKLFKITKKFYITKISPLHSKLH